MSARSIPARTRRSSLPAAAPGRSGISADQTWTLLICRRTRRPFFRGDWRGILYGGRIREVSEDGTDHARIGGLLVVDIQRGFTTLCPEELPVPGGLEIVPNVNRLL